MKLEAFSENLQRRAAAGLERADEDVRAAAEHLLTSLDAAIRLTLQDVVAAAAAEITCALAPDSVEVRLRGQELEFVCVRSQTRSTEAEAGPDGDLPVDRPDAGLITLGEDGAMTRINLRMPDHLKARVERAAEEAGLSVNAWLVRAAAAAVERTAPDQRPPSPGPRGAARYKGWVR